MVRLNELGTNILELKKELMCETYSYIVHKALLDSVTKMLETFLIDKETYTYLNNNDISVEELEKIILIDKKFIKTKEEIIKEMEEKSLHYENELSIKDLSIEVDEDTETFLFKKKFVLDKSFFDRHFQLKDEIIESVMAANGFAATYALLRLPKIISEFLQEKVPKFGLEQTASFIMEDEESPIENMFGIYIIFKFPLEESYNENIESECLEYVKDTLTNSDEFFIEKTSN